MLAILLAGLALVITSRHLRIDTNTLEMISSNVPFRRNFTAFIEAFPEFDDTIVAVIEGDVPERVEQAAAALASALRADRAHFTAIACPAGEPFFARNGLLFLEVDELAELTDRLAAAQPLLAALSEDPSLRGLASFIALALEHQLAESGVSRELDRLLDAMAKVVEAQAVGEFRELSWQRAMAAGPEGAPDRAILVVEPRLDDGSLMPAAAAIAALRAVAQRLGIDAEHGLELGLTGPAVLDQEELESASSGALLAAGLATLAVAALLFWGLGSLRMITATLITLVVGLLLTAAFATLTIGRLNLISVTFAVLFVGLGIDFGIHLVLRYEAALLRKNCERRRNCERRALRAAVAGIGGPLSLSALCAACGFLAFAPTAYRGLAELGIISAAGMAIAWLSSLTLLPALLVLLRPPPRQRQTMLQLMPARHGARHRLVIGAAMLGGFASLAALPAVTFDFNPLNLKEPTSESVRALEKLAADPVTSTSAIGRPSGAIGVSKTTGDAAITVAASSNKVLCSSHGNRLVETPALFG